MSKILVIFLLIIFAAAGMLGFWHWQQNQYSKEVLKLEILGQASAQVGEEVEYSVKFKNNGKVRLERPELIFEYPEHAIPFENQSLRTTQPLEDIYPGEERIIEFKARVFGREQDILEAKTWLSYKPKNLKARYESKTSFSTRIHSIPLTFEFDLPLKVEQGEEISFSLNYFSNIDYVLENLRAQIEYPDGFQFLSSQPKDLDEAEWALPSLGQADGGRIEIKGAIEGEEGEKKIFQAKLGMFTDGDFILLKEVTQSVEIIAPAFYVSQMLNGSQNYIANSGDLLHYEVFFKNIGKKPIQKKFLFVKLEGDSFDLSTLKSEKGDIGRGDNSILWDWKKVSDLRFLDADDEGKVEFWVKVKEDMSARKIENPLLKSKVTVGGTEKNFETKINTEIQLEQKVYFQEDVFGNSGPLPPEAGKDTSYTVLWHIRNSCNALSNVKVKARLPENITVTGKIFPEDAKFTFDSKSREAIWNIGDLEAFQGFEETPFTLAFQIKFAPDDSQKGKTPYLIQEADVIGEDSWTEEILHEKAPAVDVSLPDDETVTEKQEIVQ